MMGKGKSMGGAYGKMPAKGKGMAVSVSVGMAPKAKPAPMGKAPKSAMPPVGTPVAKPAMSKGKMAPAVKSTMPKRTKM
jgi:hypothetical protein